MAQDNEDLYFKMKAYTQTQICPSHGRRIYIPYEHLQGSILHRMNSLSIDGREQKDTGKCLGWEFSSQRVFANRFNEAVAYLTGYGFVLEECSGNNTTEVWK